MVVLVDLVEYMAIGQGAMIVIVVLVEMVVMGVNKGREATVGVRVREVKGSQARYAIIIVSEYFSDSNPSQRNQERSRSDNSILNIDDVKSDSSALV